jgi:hypothetical protein
MAAAFDPLLARLLTPDPRSGTVSPRGVLDGAASVYLWGSSRATVNSVLYALARQIDPEFTWLSVRDGTPPPVDQLLARGVDTPRANSVAVRPEALIPGPRVKIASLSWMVSFGERPEELDQLRAFLALPPPLQEVVGRPVPQGAPRILAIPNADHLAALFEARIEMLAALARVLKESGVSILVAQTQRDGPLREIFDYAFRVHADGLDSWREGNLVCEQTPQARASEAGVSIPLRRLTWMADVLDAANALASG